MKRPKIIYEDRQILVIDKPTGMPSVYVKGGEKDTLSNWLIENYPKQKKLKEKPEEAGLISRLDNDTSGLIVAAKTGNSYTFLKEQWTERETLKQYIALVLGSPDPEGRITTLIAHHPDKASKMITVTNPTDTGLKGRYAETQFRTLEEFLDYTLLSVRIKTGARHQIRCHLSSIGHPIAGDSLYQRTKHRTRDWLGLRRPFLHACRVGFLHPKTEKYVEYESALPEELQTALTKCSGGL